MTFKLKKSGQSRQKLLADAIRKGLPLAGLFAMMPFAGGCEKNNMNVRMGDVEQVTTAESRSVTGGNSASQPRNQPEPQNQKRENVSDEYSRAGDLVEPPPKSEKDLPGETQVYTVKSGDTLSSIAKKYDVPLEVITELNHFAGEQEDKLSPGQKILLPKSANLKNETTDMVIRGAITGAEKSK